MGRQHATAVLFLSALAAAVAGGQAVAQLNGFTIESHIVAREAIVPGGPQRDVVRAVDHPRFVPAAQVEGLSDSSPVLGIHHGGEARAYPIHFLEWHQIVNDEIAGLPIVVTYGPLVGTPRVFQRRVEGTTLRFGVSGLIYNSNGLLFDRGSESLWSQFTGRAISGRYAERLLVRLPHRHDTLASWVAQHPDTVVLGPPETERIAYDPTSSPYEPYWIDDRPAFPVPAEDRRFHAKELVLGVVVRGAARAYLGSLVARAGGRVEDRFGGVPIRVAFSPESGLFRYDVPAGVEVSEAYWFAWKAFYPETDVWRDPGRVPGRDR